MDSIVLLLQLQQLNSRARKCWKTTETTICHTALNLSEANSGEARTKACNNANGLVNGGAVIGKCRAMFALPLSTDRTRTKKQSNATNSAAHRQVQRFYFCFCFCCCQSQITAENGSAKLLLLCILQA